LKLGAAKSRLPLSILDFMLLDITIVTAFFDLGREKWTPEQGFTEGFQRSTDVYLERFSNLAAFENELVVYTSPEFVAEVQGRRRGKEDRTTIIPLPFFDLFQDRRETICLIQRSPEFIARINPVQHRNPERVSPDYVLLTNLKPYFVLHAVQNGFVRNGQVAWIDFGYFRSAEQRAGSDFWQYAFATDKMHLFGFTPYRGEIALDDIVANNVAYIVGGCVVGRKELWASFAALTNRAAQELATRSLVDNDQTLFLMASLYRPDLFDIHLVGVEGWWDPFRYFNINAKT